MQQMIFGSEKSRMHLIYFFSGESGLLSSRDTFDASVIKPLLKFGGTLNPVCSPFVVNNACAPAWCQHY